MNKIAHAPAWYEYVYDLLQNLSQGKPHEMYYDNMPVYIPI